MRWSLTDRSSRCISVEDLNLFLNRVLNFVGNFRIIYLGAVAYYESFIQNDLNSLPTKWTLVLVVWKILLNLVLLYTELKNYYASKTLYVWSSALPVKSINIISDKIRSAIWLTCKSFSAIPAQHIVAFTDNNISFFKFLGSRWLVHTATVKFA